MRERKKRGRQSKVIRTDNESRRYYLGIGSLLTAVYVSRPRRGEEDWVRGRKGRGGRRGRGEGYKAKRDEGKGGGGTQG